MDRKLAEGYVLEFDMRINKLTRIVNVHQQLIEEYEGRMQLEPWYDGDHFCQDAEEIFGLTLITFQNYINSSIYERKVGGKPFDTTIDFYEIGQKINNSSVTNIQLIIAISNYYKHRDHIKSLHQHTTEILDKLDLAL